MLRAVLPKPPSVNHYWRFSSKPFPRWYVSAKGKTYREEAGWIWKQALGRGNILSSEVELVIDFYYCRHTDIDNILKATLDTMTTAGVLVDDRQVAGLNVRRYKVATMKEERLEVEVREL